MGQGTLPDIAFAVNDVSRFNNKHGRAHWTAVKRIFRYIKGSIDMKLFFSNSDALTGYTDADWASDVDKRRSSTGFVFTMSGGAVSWNSRRQDTVALSSTEAEYMALSSATQEAIWLKQFGEEIDSSLEKRPIKAQLNRQKRTVSERDPNTLMSVIITFATKSRTGRLRFDICQLRKWWLTV